MLATELVVETDDEACKKDENEVCFLCSLPDVEFERQGIARAIPMAAPVLDGECYGGTPIYFSDVIVHRDSPFSSFLDLRGRSWADDEPLSHSGYGITRYHLVEIREAHGYFGEVIEAGFHEESVRMVAAQEVDASAIHSQVLAVMMRDDPSLTRSLRIIEALGPSTIQPVAVSKRVPLKLRAIDRFFVKAVKEIHGADLTQPMPGPLPETVAAWFDSTVKGRGRGMALCAPLTPGETERARAFVADAYRRDEFTASRRRLNVSVELLTHHSTPQGDIVGIYIEGGDPAKSNAGFAASQDPFDLWFKEELTKVFPPTVDWSKPVEGVEEIFDSTKIADLSLDKAA